MSTATRALLAVARSTVWASSGPSSDFWQQADGVWEYLLAVLKGLFWPAVMVYEVFAVLGR